jgi:hypothetical protein
MHIRKHYTTVLFVIALTVFIPLAATAQAWDPNSGNLVFTNPAAGRVGIGTSAPANKLHVFIDDGAANTPLKVETYGPNSISGISLKTTQETGISESTVRMATS